MSTDRPTDEREVGGTTTAATGSMSQSQDSTSTERPNTQSAGNQSLSGYDEIVQKLQDDKAKQQHREIGKDGKVKKPRVGLPESKEDWDNFIVSYSSGMLSEGLFPTGTTPGPSTTGSYRSIDSPAGSPPRSIRSKLISQSSVHSRENSPAPASAVKGQSDLGSGSQAREFQIQQPEETRSHSSGPSYTPRPPPFPASTDSPAPTHPSARSVPSDSSVAVLPDTARPETNENEVNPVETKKEESDLDQHPDVSTAGPSNQDPNIPNIPSNRDTNSGDASRSNSSTAEDSSEVEQRDFAYEPDNSNESGEDGQLPGSKGPSSSREKVKSRRTSKDGDGAKGNRLFRDWRKGDAVQEGGLTMENMRQLNIQSSRRRHKDKSRRDQVELASVRRGESRDSDTSESGEERANAEGPSLTSFERGHKRPKTRKPTSRGSLRSLSRKESSRKGDGNAEMTGNGSILLDSATGSTTNSGSMVDLDYDIEKERNRIRDFYNANGYLPAPRQTPEGMRRRLRVIRRLGFDDNNPAGFHPHFADLQNRLQRFVRLAASYFKTSGSVISIVGREASISLAAVGFPCGTTEAETAFCGHTIVAAPTDVLIVPDTTKDWRFRRNPLVDEGKGPIKFYAGAPLVIGRGKAAVIGTLCVMGDKVRPFDEDDKLILKDIAEAVVSELELLYTQTSAIESAKLHQISVEFLRRSLRSRPLERAGMAKGSNVSETSGQKTQLAEPKSGGSGDKNSTDHTSSSHKRKEGADHHESEADIDIYDEACSEIRHALDAYAVAVVDLSQFHLFYPAFGGSSTGGSTRTKNSTDATTVQRGQTSTSNTEVPRTSTTESTWKNSADGIASTAMDSEDGYARDRGSRRPKKTYALSDPTAPSRTPQVLYIPAGTRTGSRSTGKSSDGTEEELAVLGYSCAHDNFAFNFTSSPAVKKIISEFIAANVKTRQVWYTRDDSEGIAQSINHLMPPGTETSLAMPIFGFDGQVAFAIVACWTDPLYTYPAGAMQFVETIAGSLLASVMKERLHQAERAQLNFAAAASHELRTPLHQINAAASLLRQTLQNWVLTPRESPLLEGSRADMAEILSPPMIDPPSTDTLTPLGPETPDDVMNDDGPSLDTDLSQVTRPSLLSFPSSEKQDAMAQLDIIESNGTALGMILENIIDTLDIGRLTSRLETKALPGFLDPEQMGQTSGQDGSVSSQHTARTGPSNAATNRHGQPRPAGEDKVTPTASLDEVLEKVVLDSISLEEKFRKSHAASTGSIDSGGMDNVEVVLEMLPRSRGTWKMAQDPGPLARAIGKIVHNSCKYTDKGHVTITVQDVSRGVIVPAGYDNSIRSSIVSIDIKDTGRGMSSEFLEREVLRPFSKTESFTPGSGLGLGLAQRMIELLGGKLAIASQLGQGTIVHIEVPIQLYNDDNESDQEELEARGGHTPLAEQSRSAGSALSDSGNVIRASNASAKHGGDTRQDSIRQDGIYLVGFDVSAAVKRAGRAVLRQLKMNMCRVVPEISYASAIVAPSSIRQSSLIDLARKAREGVEIILIAPRASPEIKSRRSISRTSSSASGSNADDDGWEGIPVRTVHRPIRPSVIAEIMRSTRPERTSEPGSGFQSPSLVSPVPGETPNSAFSPAYTPTSRLASTSRPALTNFQSFDLSSRPQRPSFPGISQRMSYHGRGSERRGEISTSNASVPSTVASDENILPSPTAPGLDSPPLSPKYGATRIIPPLFKGDGDVYSSKPSNRHGRHGSISASTTSAQVESQQSDGQVSVDEVTSGVDRVRLDDRSVSVTSFGTSSTPVSEDLEGESEVERGVPQARSRMGSIHTEGEATTHGHGSVISPMDLSFPEKLPTVKSKGPLRVLVVEDNDVNRRILVTMCKRSSCVYAEANDGVEAVEKYSEFSPHLILLDINMPRKDGFQAASEIRNIERRRRSQPGYFDEHQSTPSTSTPSGRPVPAFSPPPKGEGVTSPISQTRENRGPAGAMRCRILAVTAMSSEAHRRKGMVECGIDMWLAKPVGIKQLKEEIERAKGEMIEA